MSDINARVRFTSTTPGDLKCKRTFTRRDFLQASGIAALGLGGAVLLSGCGPAAEGTSDGSESAENASGNAMLGDGSVLRVGMEAAYAPYNWQVSEESEYTIPIENVSGAYADGYDVQIAKRSADAFGVEPVAVKLSFDGLVDALVNGQIDIICAGMSTTPERAETIDFSDSYLDDDIVVITKQDSQYASATTLEDLSGASVLGQQATMYDEVIEQIPDVNHMTPAETVPLVVERLESGACDAITFSKMSAPRLLDTYPDFVVLDLTDGFEGSQMPDNAGVAKGQDAALAVVNEAIAAIPDDERQELWTACMERQPE